MAGKEVDHTSWVGDLGHFLGLIALIFYAVAIGTPAWADQDLTVPGREDATFGRGLWQAYEYDGYGVITLYNYYVDDRNGNAEDPFCGSSNATFAPDINEVLAEAYNITVVRDRSNNSNDWCLRRRTVAGFALLAIIFTLVAFFTSVLRQRGWCSETFYAIMAFLATVSAFFACVIMGAFIDEEDKRVSDQQRNNRLFPTSQEVVAGYSFIVFLFAFVLSLLSFLLSLCEICRSKPASESSKKKASVSSEA